MQFLNLCLCIFVHMRHQIPLELDNSGPLEEQYDLNYHLSSLKYSR